MGPWDERLIDQASDVPSIIFFIISYRLRTLKTFYFCKFMKNSYKIEKIFARNFARNYEKKILGTSDDWSMSHLSHRPSNPVYYIEDWWIFCNHFLQCEYGWAAGYQEIGKEACLHLSSSNGLLLFILYTSCSRDYFALSSKTLMLLPTFSFSFFVLFMYAL